MYSLIIQFVCLVVIIVMDVDWNKPFRNSKYIAVYYFVNKSISIAVALVILCIILSNILFETFSYYIIQN